MLAQRAGLGLLAIVVLTPTLLVLGVPEAGVRAISWSALFTVLFTEIHPAGTPHRWRKNVIRWLMFFAVMLCLRIGLNYWLGV